MSDEPKMIRYHDREVLKVGRHLYAVCDECHGWVKLTGWFKGLHLCR